LLKAKDDEENERDVCDALVDRFVHVDRNHKVLHEERPEGHDRHQEHDDFVLEDGENSLLQRLQHDLVARLDFDFSVTVAAAGFRQRLPDVLLAWNKVCRRKLLVNILLLFRLRRVERRRRLDVHLVPEEDFAVH